MNTFTLDKPNPAVPCMASSSVLYDEPVAVFTKLRRSSENLINPFWYISDFSIIEGCTSETTLPITNPRPLEISSACSKNPRPCTIFYFTPAIMFTELGFEEFDTGVIFPLIPISNISLCNFPLISFGLSLLAPKRG